MPDTPDLDQVTAARRAVADQARFPTAYWVVYGVVLVLFAGLPIWMTWLPGADRTYLMWGLVAICLASAAYSVARRRRSGIYLSKRIGAYPSAVRMWWIGIAATVVGFFGIQILVDHAHRDIALVVLPVVAAVVFVTQVRSRSAMAADIEAGRVRP